MDEESIDNDAFVITQPVWVLVERGSVAIDDQSRMVSCGDSAVILAAGLPQGSTVLLFTDQDLAERHAKLVVEAKLEPATFDSVDNFFLFLRWMQETNRAVNLMFDPGSKPSVKDKWDPIERFLRLAKRS